MAGAIVAVNVTVLPNAAGLGPVAMVVVVPALAITRVPVIEPE